MLIKLQLNHFLEMVHLPKVDTLKHLSYSINNNNPIKQNDKTFCRVLSSKTQSIPKVTVELLLISRWIRSKVGLLQNCQNVQMQYKKWKYWQHAKREQNTCALCATVISCVHGVP